MDSRTVIKKLEDAGFVQARKRGSHVFLFNAATRKAAVVPHPKRDLPPGTVASIERQSGVRLR